MIFKKFKMYMHTPAKRFCATPIPDKGIKANKAN